VALRPEHLRVVVTTQGSPTVCAVQRVACSLCTHLAGQAIISDSMSTRFTMRSVATALPCTTLDSWLDPWQLHAIDMPRGAHRCILKCRHAQTAIHVM